MSNQFGYRVVIDQYCDHSEYSDEAYGPWSTSHSNSFGSICKTEQYPDVTSEHDFAVGERVFVVWAEWSSGDSFGNGDRCSVEAFGVFKTGAEATAYQQELESANHSGDRWLPWFGYFESLDAVHVECATICG